MEGEASGRRREGEAQAGARVAGKAVRKPEEREKTQPQESSEITSRARAGSRQSERERASSPPSRARQPPDLPESPPKHCLVLSAPAAP